MEKGVQMTEFNPQPQQQQALDLRQLQGMRQQQAVGKLQNIMSIALQMFLQGKTDNIPQAFVLAKEFVNHFELVVIPDFEREQARQSRPT